MSSVNYITYGRIRYGIALATATIIVWEALRVLNSSRTVSSRVSKDSDPSDSENALDNTANGHLQHHVIPTSQHQEGLKNFIDAANHALISAYPQDRNTGPQRYSRVSALLILWEEDDLGVETEINQLSNVFRGQYGYECDIFAIPEESPDVDPEAALVNRIMRFKREALQDHFLIVYYGGHSDDGNGKHSIWKSKLNSTSNVNWSLAQSYLLTCPADVLVLLDTCFAARGGQGTAGSTVGSNELIAATNESSLARGVDRFSFTKVLIEVLKDFAERHKIGRELLTAVWLSCHMRTNYHNHKLKKVPYYMSFDDHRSPSAIIVPRPGSAYAYLSSIFPAPALDIGSYRVIVSIEVNGTPSGDIVTWLEGQGAPARYIKDVEIIKITAVHRSNSSVLLVEIPPAVWLLLSPKVAGTFVGLVQSGNLLNEGEAIQEIPDGAIEKKIDDALIVDPPPPYDEAELEISQQIIVEGLLLQREFEAWRDAGDPRATLHPKFADQYPYKALNNEQFRLVRLLAGEHNDPLQGICVTVDVRSVPHYIALSYVWGPPSELNQDPEWISLDGIRIELRPNVISALRALRDPTSNIHVWVDILCINQRNSEEQARQVSLMTAICRRSGSVIAWLGNDNHLERLAFSFAQWMVRHPSSLFKISPKHLYTCLDALFTVMRNRWFQKKWAVADCVLANELIFCSGYNMLPWNILVTAVHIIALSVSELLPTFLAMVKCPNAFLEMMYDFEYQAVYQFASLRTYLLRGLEDPLILNSRIVFSSLVLRTSLLVATTPQDALLSMRGVALDWNLANELNIRDREADFVTRPTEPPTTIPPKSAEDEGTWSEAASFDLPQSAPTVLGSFDLSEVLPLADYSIPVDEFFTDFVRKTIYLTRQLDIICQPWAPEVLKIPSWIRTKKDHAFAIMEDNRHSRINADNLATPTPRGHSIYSASGLNCCLTEEEARAIMSSRGEGLTLLGISLGTVVQQMASAVNGVLPEKWFALEQVSGASSSPENILWRTLVADRGPDGIACQLWYEAAYQQAFQHRRDKFTLDTRGLMFESLSTAVFKYLNRVQAVVWGRRLVRTDTDNHLVLAPGSSRVGDQVWLLKGCSVPVILRPQSRPRSSSEIVRIDKGYTLVGECYVHGIMDGEMFEKSTEAPTWTSVLLR